MDWWDKWARLDPGYSPAPYAQLAAALTSAGEHDAANEIRYRGRVRERETEKGLAYVWSGFLQYVAGFGIGTYTFRVLNWVMVITVFGALYLKESVKGVRDEKHGFIWCFGASLSRLLPAIEINKEFTAFFDDPERKRLTGWQSFIFSAMAIVVRQGLQPCARAPEGNRRRPQRRAGSPTSEGSRRAHPEGP